VSSLLTPNYQHDNGELNVLEYGHSYVLLERLVVPQHQFIYTVASQLTTLTAVERYFARSLGFAQMTIGLLVVCLSGAIPLTSMTENPADAPSPYAAPVILISSMYQGMAAFYSYTRYNETGETGYFLGCLGSSTFAAFGLWCMMFGGQSRISRRTGADKRTSGFPFKNTESDKRKAR